LLDVLEFTAKIGKNQKTKVFFKTSVFEGTKKQAHQKNSDAPLKMGIVGLSYNGSRFVVSSQRLPQCDSPTDQTRWNYAMVQIWRHPWDTALFV